MSEAPTVNFRDFFVLAPEIVLAAWGLLLVMVDLIGLRRRSVETRRLAIGSLALVGTLVALATTLLPLAVRYDWLGASRSLNMLGIDPVKHPDPYLLFGTLSGDLLTEVFNLLYVVLLMLIVHLSMAWSFTEEWGEYAALLFWSTAGMMLLTASEELLTLFLTLETMTIGLYLVTAFEKQRRRSAEGGLKYFVYGSVSSALFLFGLSLIYGLTGSTQLSAIREVLQPNVGRAVGLHGNLIGVTALLLLLVGFGFKIAAVPFHQWAPDAYEGAPAPVTAWIASGSKMASFIAMMKVLLHALGPWSSTSGSVAGPGWVGIVALLSAASMTYGNFAALAQRNLKRMLAYSSIAHAGYMLVGVAAAAVSANHEQAAGAVLYYLVIYGFTNVGAFAVAAWLARDKGTDDIDDLNGLGAHNPGLALCILLLMLSLIGMPPLAGFFGKLYMFMEALNQDSSDPARVTLVWLVALGLFNSVISAFYYVRVLRAMYLRRPERGNLAAASSPIAWPILISTAVVLAFGLNPAPLMNVLRTASVQMLTSSGMVSGEPIPGEKHRPLRPVNYEEPAKSPPEPMRPPAPKS